MRHRTSGLAAVVLLILSCACTLGAIHGDASNASWTSPIPGLADLVFVTEDWASPNETPSGCDAISIASVERSPVPGPNIDLPLFSGPFHVSPGRIATTSDFRVVLAMSTNGFPFIYRLYFDADQYPPAAIPTSSSPSQRNSNPTRIRIDDGPRALSSSAIAIMDDGDTVLVTRRDRPGDPWRPAGPFTLDKHRLSEVQIDGAVGPRLGSQLKSVEVSGIAVEVLHDLLDSDVVHVVSHLDIVHSIRVSTMAEISPAVQMATIARLEDVGDSLPAALIVGAADLSTDGRYLITNRWYDRQINVTDLVLRRARTVDVPDVDANRVGDVAINKAAVNRGLLAIHGESSVGIYEFDPSGPPILRQVTRFEVPRFQAGSGDLRRTIRGVGSGPVPSLAWSGSGRHLIVAGGFAQAEFGVYRVEDGGITATLEKRLRVCGSPKDWPLDIVTVNKRLSPPSPTPTASPTALATRTEIPTVLPTGTSTTSATPSPSASATALPRPIYVPVALVERCDPSQQRIDVAVVLDASTSMSIYTRRGRPKIDAALDAARAFLDLLTLGDLDGDQAAIVSFNADARLLAPLTSDRASLDAALNSITLAQQTRIDLAVAAGASALADPARRRSGNQPVLVLLTDGRANPVPIEAAVAEAELAKGAGVMLFTIGLGDDIDAVALSVMASRPQDFLQAPDAEDLADVYRMVARNIPCPASAWWGGR